MPVMMPQRKSNKEDSAVASAVGSYVGGKMGGDKGSDFGSALGGSLASDKGGQMPAMERRQKRIGSDMNLATLEQANQALGQLPPEQQKQYGPAIQTALEMERKQRGMA